ncbi:MAG: OmpA family protein [Geminicoccaceae bacterium]
MARWARCGRAALLALALAVSDGAALAQSADDAASVAQLKAALAELRRRLAEQARPATDAELQVARRQIERLTATMAGLRRERDGLRGEVLSLRDALGTARVDGERLRAANAEQARRLAASEAETAQLREAALANEPQALQAVEPVEPAERREVLAGSAFASGKAELRADAMVELAAIAAWLRDLPAGTVLIEGFTDASGEEEANRRLSLARAGAVRDRLVALGVGIERLQVVGRGEASPVADNATPEGRAANRRVEISVQR